jgi:hypothetical protein
VKFSGPRNTHRWRVSAYAHDNGQRYEVRYTDGIGQRMTYGYTDDLKEAERLAAKAEEILFVKNVRVIDRKMLAAA